MLAVCVCVCVGGEGEGEEKNTFEVLAGAECSDDAGPGGRS